MAAASAIGVSLGSVVFFASSFSLLSSAVSAEFGWRAADMAYAAAIFLGGQALTLPLWGWLIDRFGTRRMAAAGIALFAVSLVVLSRAASLTGFYLAFALMSVVSGPTNVVSYARVISLWFTGRRGLALGAVAGAQAGGSVLLPLAMQWSIATGGWSEGLLALAALEIVVCCAVVLPFVKDPPGGGGSRREAARADEAPVDGQGRAFLRSPVFWGLMLCFAIAGLTFYAITTHMVFILGWTSGILPREAARVLAAGGAAVLLGRLACGFLLDKMSPPVVAIGLYLLAALAAGLFAWGTSYAVALCAAVLLGFNAGGEGDLMPYLAGRYFGLRSVARVLGWFIAAFFTGAIAGTVLLPMQAAAWGTAQAPLLALVAMQVIAVGIFARLAYLARG